MGLKAVIFDIDGLMIDSERISQRSWGQVMEEAGYPLSHELYLQMIGRTEKDVKQILRNAFGEQFPFEEMYRRREDRFLELIGRDGIPTKPGLLELLDWIKRQDLKLAVASSTYCKLAEMKLAAAGIRERFEIIVTGDEVTNGKPAPDLFLAAAQKVGEQPEACVVLEDSQAGIQAAYAAGMRSILVPDMQPVEEPVRKLATYIATDLNQAITILESII